jgi:S1-C subfamily serine protease
LLLLTTIDWIALGLIALAALLGLRKGMVASALSAAGIVVGALVGARLAPHLLPGGDDSPYTPLVGLAGAAIGAVLLETAGSVVGGMIRRALALPPLRLLDSFGGLIVGGAAGLAVVWVLGAAALHFPGQTELRQTAQRSTVLQTLNDVVPPARLMDAIERVDPFPTFAGPLAPVDPPDAAVLARPGVGRAAASVVRVLGSACGLAVSGSGWVARPHLVVTAAHVVAGQRDTVVAGPGGRGLRARAVVFDPKNDVAVLRVPGLAAQSIPLDSPSRGESVAILGYPAGGPFSAGAGRIGRTSRVLSEDAYGEGPVLRTITTLRGRIRRGNSGGPAVNASGRVEAMVFAARVGSEGGFGVPPSVVRDALDSVGASVSTGDCAP